MDISPFMSQWLGAKEEWIRRLNGCLTYELPGLVSFELNEESKRENLEKFAEKIDEHYSNYLLAKFLYHISSEEFYNNKTNKEYNIGLLTIPANFKVVKAFKFFEKDETILKELQSSASRVI